MATNKRIEENKKKQAARKQHGNLKFNNFMERFREMKNRTGWNYRPPGI